MVSAHMDEHPAVAIPPRGKQIYISRLFLIYTFYMFYTAKLLARLLHVHIVEFGTIIANES